jgi:hypothetical protein
VTEERSQFPVDALPKPIAEQVSRIAAYQNVDPALPAIGFLAGASFAIGRGFDYALNATTSTITPSNLWITPVVPSGGGKSTLIIPIRIIEEIYKEQELEWKSQRKPELVAELKKIESRLEEYKRSKLWDKVTEATKELYDKNAEIAAGRPAWLHENFTTETLSAAFSCPGRTAYACIVAPEGRSIVQNLVSGYHDRSSEGFWLAGWSRVDTNIRTRAGFHLSDADGVIDGLQISACFGLQPDKHEELMKPPFSVSGWSQRRLFCLIQPSDYVSEDQAAHRAQELNLAAPDLKQWEAWVRKMIKRAFSPVGRRCMPDTDAITVLNDWYTLINSKIHDGLFSEMESHARRWGEIATRIALCLHCMEHADLSDTVKISGDTMKKAIDIMRYFAREMHKNYWRVEIEGKSKKREAIEKYALTKGVHGFSMRDLSHGGIGTKNELMPVIERMIEDKKLQQLPVTVTPGKTGPRPVRWIHSRVAGQAGQDKKLTA